MQGSCKLSVLSLNLLVQVYLEELMHPDQLDGELNLAPGFLLLFIVSYYYLRKLDAPSPAVQLS